MVSLLDSSSRTRQPSSVPWSASSAAGDGLKPKHGILSTRTKALKVLSGPSRSAGSRYAMRDLSFYFCLEHASFAMTL